MITDSGIMNIYFEINADVTLLLLIFKLIIIHI